jgi:hypothetical protein
MSRIILRILLLVVLLLSIAVVIASLRALSGNDLSAWAGMAAALAVITSVVSAWGAQRLLEIQQDNMLPNPYPSIDVQSRYELLQLRITNFGDSVAHNIRIKWDQPLLNSKGEPVVIGQNTDDPYIPILIPKGSISTLIDGHVQFFGKHKDANYSSCIFYEDASGNKYDKRFSLSAEIYRNTLVFSEEEPKTHHELQKLPDAIAELTRAVNELKNK